MAYHRSIRIEFNHCDPAGIVFYPRYFEMTNSVIENFFRDELESSFDRMIENHRGAPTVQIDISFKAPSRLGEILDWKLVVDSIGASSVRFRIEAAGAGQIRLTQNITLVHVGADLRPLRWTELQRVNLERHQEQP